MTSQPTQAPPAPKQPVRPVRRVRDDRLGDRGPTAARRVGWVIAIVVNAVLLWVANQLPEWDWPAFLTEDYELLVGIVSLSLLASMLVNAAYLVRDRGRVRAMGDMITSVFGLIVSMRTWTVFPFDFTGYDNDWSWLVRTLLVLGIVGSAIGFVVAVVKFVRGTSR